MTITIDQLAEALSQAMETMAFMTAEPVQEEMIIPDRTLLVEMTYRGPYQGYIQIVSGLEFGRMIASNIGCLDDPDEQSVQDAYKEVCNVTCGLLLPKLSGSTADVFDISIPALTAADQAPAWESYVSQDNVSILNIEGLAVAVKLSIEPASTNS